MAGRRDPEAVVGIKAQRDHGDLGQPVAAIQPMQELPFG